MSEASFASLGPTLLARKGGAKPAMRPQLAPLPEVVAAEQLEDLGWNDMGQEDGSDADKGGADIVSIKPSAKPVEAAPKPANEDESADALTEQEPLVVAKPTKKKAAAPKARAKATKNSRRAAFTLRLDTDRHLKLRLAATMQGKSAQALVTEALDAMLSDIDDLDALADRMNGHSKHN